jgi:hypothetical protein
LLAGANGVCGVNTPPVVFFSERLRYPGHVRASTLLPTLALMLASCGPPKASQFIGQDGSRDWWSVECGEDETACWSQAKAACHDSFELHELRKGKAPPEALSLGVHDGVIPRLPAGSTIRGKTILITCNAPTVPPRFVAGPECATSPPRPNHCDDADGFTFSTGRTYLPPAGEGAQAVAVETIETKGKVTPEAALAELRTLADGLDPEVDALGQPLALAEGVAKAIHDFPRTYRINPAQWKAIVKAQIGPGTTPLPANLRPEVIEDMSLLLAKAKAADAALSATTPKAEALLEKIASRLAKVDTLAPLASAHWDALKKSATASASEKAAADAGVAQVLELQFETRRKLEAIRTTVMGVSSQIAQARVHLIDAAS